MTAIDDRALDPGTVAVLGVPFDANSSLLRGPALAPARIRETLHSGSANWTTERGLDLGAHSGWADVGDLAPAPQRPLDQIEQACAGLLERGARVLALGGDHSITYPLLRAHARHHQQITILHLDAHPDLYDSFEGKLDSHACPFARIMEQGLASRLVQLGIRTLNAHQRQQAERFGAQIIDMRQWQRGYRLDLAGPVYLSLDLDVLDPAFAPGVSHHEPGGLTTREVLTILHDLPGPIIGADLVEFNPLRDPAGTTAMVAAKLYKEIVGHMLEAA